MAETRQKFYVISISGFAAIPHDNFSPFPYQESDFKETRSAPETVQSSSQASNPPLIPDTGHTVFFTGNWKGIQATSQQVLDIIHGYRISLRQRGIMIGGHFHANMKVQTAMCKDNNNSKSRAAACVKFEINIK